RDARRGIGARPARARRAHRPAARRDDRRRFAVLFEVASEPRSQLRPDDRSHARHRRKRGGRAPASRAGARPCGTDDLHRRGARGDRARRTPPSWRAYLYARDRSRAERPQVHRPGPRRLRRPAVRYGLRGLMALNTSTDVGKDRRAHPRTAVEDRWRTALTSIAPNKILIRGYPVDEMMGRLSFAEA